MHNDCILIIVTKKKGIEVLWRLCFVTSGMKETVGFPDLQISILLSKPLESISAMV